MLRYLGCGKHEFYLESGEKIILTDRDIINIRSDIYNGSKVYDSHLESVIDLARSEIRKSKNKNKKK